MKYHPQQIDHQQNSAAGIFQAGAGWFSKTSHFCLKLSMLTNKYLLLSWDGSVWLRAREMPGGWWRGLRDRKPAARA